MTADLLRLRRSIIPLLCSLFSLNGSDLLRIFFIENQTLLLPSPPFLKLILSVGPLANSLPGECFGILHAVNIISRVISLYHSYNLASK